MAEASWRPTAADGEGVIVRARGVRKAYRGGAAVLALRGIDLDIARGEMVAIMGPCGSGKTTLLNCLSGLERIDAGTVVVDGADVAQLHDDDCTAYRSRHMGFIFQAFNLLPVLSAVENVEFRSCSRASPLATLVGEPGNLGSRRARCTRWAPLRPAIGGRATAGR